ARRKADVERARDECGPREQRHREQSRFVAALAAREIPDRENRAEPLEEGEERVRQDVIVCASAQRSAEERDGDVQGGPLQIRTPSRLEIDRVPPGGVVLRVPPCARGVAP